MVFIFMTDKNALLQHRFMKLSVSSVMPANALASLLKRLDKVMELEDRSIKG